MTTLVSNDVSTPRKNTPKPGRGLLIGGFSLLSLGAIWLAASSILGHDNWWAVFILVPALALLAAAGRLWQASGGRYNLGVRLALLAGMPTLMTAAIFMLRIDWSIGWTLMLMLMGLVVLANGFTRPGLAIGGFWRAVTDNLFWIGASLLGLGLTFLLDRLGVISLQAMFGATRWWSAFILLPGLGALLNALIYRLKGHPATAANQMAWGMWMSVYAAGHFAQVGERWLVPAMLIAAGLAIMLPRLAPADQ